MPILFLFLARYSKLKSNSVPTFQVFVMPKAIHTKQNSLHVKGRWFSDIKNTTAYVDGQ